MVHWAMLSIATKSDGRNHHRLCTHSPDVRWHFFGFTRSDAKLIYKIWKKTVASSRMRSVFGTLRFPFQNICRFYRSHRMTNHTALLRKPENPKQKSYQTSPKSGRYIETKKSYLHLSSHFIPPAASGSTQTCRLRTIGHIKRSLRNHTFQYYKRLRNTTQPQWITALTVIRIDPHVTIKRPQATSPSWSMRSNRKWSSTYSTERTWSQPLNLSLPSTPRWHKPYPWKSSHSGTITLPTWVARQCF